MLHLLPQYQKNKVIREYRMRLVVVFIGILFFFAVIFAIFTLPTFMILQNQKPLLITQKESLTQIINTGGNVSADTNLEIWNAVDALVPFQHALIPSAYIEAVTPKVSGINIDGYTFVQTSPGQLVSAGVNGVADTREALTEYVRELSTSFDGIKLPLASLAKQSDIPFDFKFQIDHSKVKINE